MLISSEHSPMLSLFSSTSSEPLQLFRVYNASSEASGVRLLPDYAALSDAAHQQNRSLIDAPQPHDSPPKDYRLTQTVLQIESDAPKHAYIQCPRITLTNFFSLRHGTRNQSNDLGLKLPRMHMQVRNMDKDWSFEVGLVDQLGRFGILRMSTFQKIPRLKPPSSLNSPVLLHLPLAFPPPSTNPLTSWCTITLHLPTYIPYFSSLKLVRNSSVEVNDQRQEYLGKHGSQTCDKLQSTVAAGIHMGPSSRYSHVAYVRVYATCRLRRIWFDTAGPAQKIPWEFELYGDA